MAPLQEETLSDNASFRVDTNKSEESSQDANKDKCNDAFLYYSNDKVRMNTLKLKDTGTTVASARVESNRHERKTRLSFELDPLLIMEDLMDELLLDKDESSVIAGEELERGDDSKMNLLVELLRM